MEVVGLERSLGEHPFVSGLSAAQIEFLSGCVKNQRFQAGEFLFREDAPAAQLFLVRSGRVALEVSVPQRGAVQVETLGPGDVLGWSVLFTPYRWHVDGRAVEPTLAFAVDGECLRRKVAEDVGFGYELMRRLLYEVHRRLERARLQQLDVYRTELGTRA
jgi:CRP/FNR family transcriptional regulator, cyclic AMP receptor protein